MIFVDGHVHIYDCFDVEELFDAALKNFSAARRVAGIAGIDFYNVLFLVEGKKDNWFQQLYKGAKEDGQFRRNVSSHWQVELDPAGESLVASRGELSAQKLYIVCGQQLVSKEKIEVLSLFCEKKIENGLGLTETISIIQQFQGIAVLPWGVGKWIGKRGKRIADILESQQNASFFLGDNGGRPAFWQGPSLFAAAVKQGVSVLPGSDPLPLKNEAKRVGSFGFYLKCGTRKDQSVFDCLRHTLQAPDIQRKIHSFGTLQKNTLFFSNQIRLRLFS